MLGTGFGPLLYHGRATTTNQRLGIRPTSEPYRFPSIRRLDAVDQAAIHASIYTYEHEASQSAAVIASVNPILCDDLLGQAMRENCHLCSIHTAAGKGDVSVDDKDLSISILSSG
jgi:hypothetical protein